MSNTSQIYDVKIPDRPTFVQIGKKLAKITGLSNDAPLWHPVRFVKAVVAAGVDININTFSYIIEDNWTSIGYYLPKFDPDLSGKWGVRENQSIPDCFGVWTAAMISAFTVWISALVWHLPYAGTNYVIKNKDKILGGVKQMFCKKSERIENKGFEK